MKALSLISVTYNKILYFNDYGHNNKNSKWQKKYSIFSCKIFSWQLWSTNEKKYHHFFNLYVKNFPIFRKGKENTKQQGLNALGSNQNTTLFHFQNIFIMIDLDIKITYPKLTAITTKISIHMHTQIYTFTHINHI